MKSYRVDTSDITVGSVWIAKGTDGSGWAHGAPQKRMVVGFRHGIFDVEVVSVAYVGNRKGTHEFGMYAFVWKANWRKEKMYKYGVQTHSAEDRSHIRNFNLKYLALECFEGLNVSDYRAISFIERSDSTEWTKKYIYNRSDRLSRIELYKSMNLVGEIVPTYEEQFVFGDPVPRSVTVYAWTASRYGTRTVTVGDEVVTDVVNQSRDFDSQEKAMEWIESIH